MCTVHVSANNCRFYLNFGSQKNDENIVTLKHCVQPPMHHIFEISVPGKYWGGK